MTVKFRSGMDEKRKKSLLFCIDKHGRSGAGTMIYII